MSEIEPGLEVPKISNYYHANPERQEHMNMSALAVLDVKLRSLVNGLLPYEHPGESEHRAEAQLITDYLLRRLENDPLAGRAILNAYHLSLADHSGAVSLYVDGMGGRAASYRVNYGGDNTYGFMTTSVDGALSNRRFMDFSDRPYAVGRVLATALDLCVYQDTKAIVGIQEQL